MGKKIKKIDFQSDSDKSSEIHDFINKKSKSIKNIIANNNMNEKNKQKKYKAIKRKNRGEKYRKRRLSNLLYLIFMNKRINELIMQSKIQNLLLKFYEKKLNILYESYNDIVLKKYNCLNKNIMIR